MFEQLTGYSCRSRVVFYLSKWYTRGEIASRIAIFYAGAVIASAFGGLLAFGMFQVKPSGNLFVWSYLFILEGCVTCLVAILAYFVLPKDIAHAYFLTPSEKAVAEKRMQLESMENRSEKWVWSEAISEFKTIHGWARVIIALSVGILPNSSANFLAIMVVRFGYSVTKTNLVSERLSLSSQHVGKILELKANFEKLKVHRRAGSHSSYLLARLCVFIRSFPRTGVPHECSSCT